VYLDPALTSPYEFYQYWLNDDDALAVQHVRWLTLMSADEIAALAAEQTARPEGRPAQHALAFDLTARVHGRDEAERQVRVAEAAFSGGVITDADVLEVLYREVGGFELDHQRTEWDALGLLLESRLATSASEARRLIGQGGLTVNGQRLTDPSAAIPDPVAGRYWVVRAGKKRLAVGRRG
jgi:tyrosyl-tRNA synthetase